MVHYFGGNSQLFKTLGTFFCLWTMHGGLRNSESQIENGEKLEWKKRWSEEYYYLLSPIPKKEYIKTLHFSSIVFLLSSSKQTYFKMLL